MKTSFSFICTRRRAERSATGFDAVLRPLCLDRLGILSMVEGLKASPEQAPAGRASKLKGRLIHDPFMNKSG